MKLNMKNVKSKLVNLFTENFKKFEANVNAEIVEVDQKWYL